MPEIYVGGLRPFLLGGRREWEQVGGAPLAAGFGILDDIAGVVEGVEGAGLAEDCDGLLGGFKTRCGLALAEKLGDDDQPEVGEGLVIARGRGVGSADREVEGADAGAHEGQDRGEVRVEEVVGGRGNVGSVSPLGLGELALLEAVQEAVEGLGSG